MLSHKLYAFWIRVHGRAIRFLHYPHFSGTGRLFADTNTHLILEKGSTINLNCDLRLNDKCIVNNGRSTILRIDKNGTLNVLGDAAIFYGADITVFTGGTLNIGNSFINSDSKIRCHSNITIGDDCAISHNLTIMDSNAHYLNGDNRKEDIKIGDHVWIGTHVTILSGISVGDGAVIAAGSLVNKDVEPRTMVAGVPAHVIKTDVEWSE